MNHHKTLFYLFILALLLIACEEKARKEDNRQQTRTQEKKSEQVVLIFRNPPVNNNYTFKDGVTTSNGGLHEVNYIDDQLLPRLIPLKYGMESDTVIIKTKRDIIEVEHAYRGMEKLSYLFHNGDTVLFTYNGLKPKAKVLNRKHLPYDVNYELKQRESIQKDDFPALAKARSLPRFYTIRFTDRFFKTDFKKVNQLNKEKIEKEHDLQSMFLDSLKEKNLLSEEVYTFFKTKGEYNLRKVKLYDPTLRFYYPDNTPDSILIPYIEKSLLEEQQDSLLFYGFYYDMLRYTFSQLNSTKVTTNSDLPDYKALYDTIYHHNLLSPKAKKVLLLHTMENVITQSSIVEAREYLEKFKAHVNDTTFSNYLTAKYNLDAEVSNGLALKNLSEQNQSFEQVVKQHAGNIIYVDFWASWCGPCIKALPASEELQKAYAGKNIAFIYLSLDEKEEQWLKAAKKFKVDGSDSYLVQNRYTSKMLEELNVKSIPRYLIYDKAGKLVHKNAPGPGSTQIRKLFDDHLKEKQ